ncbi:TIGR00341 family protein [Crocosphaera sp. UHCC 0190]|uniref:TIGR00341 family protein n=1 Tax=Crocosphaera sp. UHCC 0190 TaxID=3110246 RepID=UPI002B21A4E8|nr:TIGR00341 family protein [Crocosphaera sp. UHCC 0190]MEA5511232.1 TIGR00341 family protein [Crocosphaera sp. UHCC 0190]
MAASSRWSFLKKEWTLFRQLRKNVSEEKLSENTLSESFIQQILASNFSILLILATAIATFGLISNSAATIIGAMIIAPLMGPIISLAYAFVLVEFRLMSYSVIELIFGILLTIAIAFFTTQVIGFRIPGSEILARTQPTLLDLGVAIAAGTAGGFAKIRRSVSEAVPGVAIAVALVPPLCVVGISLAVYDFRLATGSFLLFLTNLVGIILSAALVFLFESYGSWKKAIWALVILIGSLLAITLPLKFSFRQMIVENQIRHALAEYSRQYLPSTEGMISSLEVNFQESKVLVIADIILTPAKLNQIDPRAKLELAQKFLIQKTKQPIKLQVRIFPMEILNYEVSPTSKTNK